MSAAPIVVEPADLEGVSWARTVDVLIVGSGGAGSLAALAVARAGGSAIVLEKGSVPHGTSGRSVGTMWIPNNRLYTSTGRGDDKAELMAYMACISWPDEFASNEPYLGLSEMAYRKIEAFYDHGAAMIDLLVAEEGAFELLFREYWEGRPMPDYMYRGAEWNDQRGHGIVMNLRHDIANAAHANGGARGTQLMAAIRALYEKRGVPILLEHRVRRLIQLPDRTVVGLEVDTPAGTRRMRARRGVIFGSGGFTRNPEYCRRFLGSPLDGAVGAGPDNEGDFITIGMESGLMMAGLDRVYGNQVAFEPTVYGGEGGGVGLGDSMVMVNRYGRRVCSEKMSGDNRVEHHVIEPETGIRPNRLMMQIWDQRTADLFGMGGPAPHIMQADTLEALADEIRRRLAAVTDYTDGFTLDDSFEAGLRGTIRQFSDDAISGHDREFQRGEAGVDIAVHFDPLWTRQYQQWKREGKAQPHRTYEECLAEFREKILPAFRHAYPNPTMHPISESGPYYAMLVGPASVDTAGGPEVNERGEVFAEDGTIVPHLYGAGACVHGPSNGGYYGGGMAMGMAMVTGWLAGQAAMTQTPL